MDVQVTQSVCTYCGEEVNPASRWTYTRIIGWHRPGNAGGSDISLRKKLDEYACVSCIEKLKAGIPVRQEELFPW